MKLIPKISGLGVFCLSLALSMPALAADLTGFSATYNVKANGKSGTATRTLSKNGNNYTYSVKASAAGIASVNQSSHFSLSGGKILPSNSSMSVKVLGVGSTHNISFNNGAKTATSTYKGKTSTYKMTGQAYDDLSLESQIRQELINGRFTGNYYLVKKSGIENTKFKLFKFEKLFAAHVPIAVLSNVEYPAPVPLNRKAVPLEFESFPPLMLAVVFVAPVPKSIFPPSVV